MALGCALHACAWRSHEADASLVALPRPSPGVSRLLWAAALMAPAVGSLVYLAFTARGPEPTGDASRDDTRYA